jgi:multiple sugar transport system permease protein
VFSVTPLLLAAYMSLHGGGTGESGGSFVGLANYAALLRDPGGAWWRSLLSTAIYALYVPVSLLLALGVALMLHRHPRGAGTIRALFVVPHAASAVAVALAWRWIYHSGFGGLTVFDWLASPRTALVGLMLVAVWSQIGGQMLLLLGGLKAIPQTYLDAARLDGAGSWRSFRRVTLPMLRPVLLLALVTGIIGAFHAFTAVRILTAGGPDGATDLVLLRLYRTGFESSQMAQASALGLLTGVLLLAFTWAQRRIVRAHA